MTPVIRSLVALVALVVAWVGPPASSFAAGPASTGPFTFGTYPTSKD